MNKTRKLYKKLLIIAIMLYVGITLINQQATLNDYTKTSESLAQELKEEEELANKKEEVNSLEFIEQTARERLDMYLPNERVYVDAGM